MVQVTSGDGFKSSDVDRAMVHLRVTAVMADQPVPAYNSAEMLEMGLTYLSSTIADLLAYAEQNDMDLEKVLQEAVSEFNDAAYRPIEITVKGSV